MHSEFTILLARQRSGTNALRSVLATHPEIYCFDEVFRRDHLVPDDPVQIRGNYFNFLEEYGRHDIARTFPDRHQQIFTDYLAHLRQLTPKHHILIDVKYNSTHHLSGMWRPIAEPTLFTELKTREIAVLHLTRRHYLRTLLSHLKAWQTNQYYVLDGAPPPDVPVNVPATWALAEFERWRIEDEHIAMAFQEYELYKRFEYAELFATGDGAMTAAALEELRAWFGVTDAFVNRASLTKQSSLPLHAAVENFDELAATLRGTGFEYCLEDEAAYCRPQRRWTAGG